MQSSDFKVNSFVSDRYNNKGRVISNTLKNPNNVAVEWKDGSVSNIGVGQLTLLEFDPDTIEKEFSALLLAYTPDIKTHVEAAAKHLNQAITIAEKHGIPFAVPNLLRQHGYIPTSFKSKFGVLDYETVQDIVGFASANGYTGWQNSSSNC